MQPNDILPPEWFQRPAMTVAQDLMGRSLCRKTATGALLRRRITEVEAYIGPEDRACHAHRGETPRNRIMFDAGGNWYVYLCYGMHWLLNITTGPAGNPEAVLIRGVEGVNGPGRVTKHLQVDGEFKNLPAGKATGLWIEEGRAFRQDQWVRTPRIGVDYAGEWKNKLFRWTLNLPPADQEDSGPVSL